MRKIAVIRWGLLLLGVGASAACTKKERAGHNENEHLTAVASASSDDQSAPPTSSDTSRERPRRNAVRRVSGDCFLSPPDNCRPDEHCKSAGSWQVDCPPSLLDAGESPTAATRPPGKEGWIRIRSWLLFDSWKKECSYQPAWFCSPPEQEAECTRTPRDVKVGCTRDEALGTLTFHRFVYIDGSAVCREVAAATCKQNARGLCDLPEGKPVPCADAGAEPTK